MYVVLVEDNESVGRSLVDLLGSHGHHTIWCLPDAVSSIYSMHADIVLFDLTQPGEGTRLLEPLRRISDAPVIVLIAATDRPSIAQVTRTGVEDHLIKPVDPDQLLEKIDRVVHRVAMRAKRVVTAADVVIDLAAREVWVGGHSIYLTPKEFNVLAVLAHQAGRVVSRHSIEEAVWGRHRVSTSQSLNVHITTLRAKINRPSLIQTIHGVGYRFGVSPNSVPPQLTPDKPDQVEPTIQPAADPRAGGQHQPHACIA